MTIENQADIDGILKTGRLVANIRDALLSEVQVGVSTQELDDLAREHMAQAGAQSAPKLMYDFPGHTCISVNEEAAHGIPGQRILQAGDVVNIDVSAEWDGYFADTGATTVVPPVSPNKARLCHATRQALQKATQHVRANRPINQVGKAIETVARAHRFKVIKNLAGHGLGRSLHEDPDNIVSYYDRRDQRVFKYGEVVAVEPFLSSKSTQVSEHDDGWTLVGQPGNLSAQYEHTLIVTRGAPIIATLSSHPSAG